MIRRLSEQSTQIIPNSHGGEGSITLRRLLTGEEEMNKKGWLFAVITLGADDTVGYHVHENDNETIYVISGTGEVNDNGTVSSFGVGDVLCTAAGEGHQLKNTGNEPLELVSMILYN